jgi:hypothetical protein
LSGTLTVCGETLTEIAGVGVGVGVGEGEPPTLIVKPGEIEPAGPGFITYTTGLPVCVQVPVAVNCVAEM